MTSLQLSEIWIYPIKSLGGIQLSTSRVLPKGLPLDRRWMLTDDQHQGITQRDYPQMALFKLSVQNDQLIVTYRQNQVSIPINNFEKKTLQAQIWNDQITTHEVSTMHSEWFSDMLGIKCHFVHFPEENPRPVEAAYRIHDDHVSLADAYPFLIIGQSSLDDLNSRLAEHIPMNRFRPNFVFTGGKPFEEDEWRNFTIGNSAFACVKPCARCNIPTINQETAEKGKEPSKTLAKYRMRNNQIYFGQNVIGLECNMVSVGDKITIQP